MIGRWCPNSTVCLSLLLGALSEEVSEVALESYSASYKQALWLPWLQFWKPPYLCICIQSVRKLGCVTPSSCADCETWKRLFSLIVQPPSAASSFKQAFLPSGRGVNELTSRKCVLFCSEIGLSMYSRSCWNSLWRPGWPPTHKNPSASAS